MPTKHWYQSKTVWATGITTVVAMYEVVSLNLPSFHLPSIQTGVLAMILAVLGSFGLYGRISATTKIGL